ncbi:MAG: NADH-quinone oxidoreductase subunit H [Xanthomonadaceae bacterium]|nr:NADH-quinone oxidoreductase subunit H [Xanthomonadaceae bacterium]
MIELRLVEFFLIFPLFVLITKFAERKWFADAQTRVGPNLIGARGLPQPAADFFNLLLKRGYSLGSNRSVFLMIFICAWSGSLLFLSPTTANMAVGEGSYSLFGIICLILFQLILQIMLSWSTSQEREYLRITKSQTLFLPAALVLLLVVIFMGVKAGSFNWAGVIRAQEGTPLNWGIFYLFPIGLIEMILFSIGGMILFRVSPLFDFPISDVFGGVDSVLLGVIQNLYFYLFSVFMVGLFFGGWNLPFGFRQSGIPGVFLSLIELAWVLFKSAFVSVSIKIILEPIAKMDADQSLSLLWRYAAPAATIGLIIVGVYQWIIL